MEEAMVERLLDPENTAQQNTNILEAIGVPNANILSHSLRGRALFSDPSGSFQVPIFSVPAATHRHTHCFRCGAHVSVPDYIETPVCEECANNVLSRLQND